MMLVGSGGWGIDLRSKLKRSPPIRPRGLGRDGDAYDCINCKKSAGEAPTWYIYHFAKISS